MNAQDYVKFEHDAFDQIVGLNQQLEKMYKLGSYKRWDYDQVTGDFVFSDNGVAKVVAKIQVVGSISSEAKTWLWSWANASILETACDQIVRVREFGMTHGIAKLSQAKWAAEEADGWEMSAVSAAILGAKGAYRCPSKNGFLFVIFTEIRFAAN